MNMHEFNIPRHTFQQQQKPLPSLPFQNPLLFLNCLQQNEDKDICIRPSTDFPRRHHHDAPFLLQIPFY